jgi:hypothetical protein
VVRNINTNRNNLTLKKFIKKVYCYTEKANKLIIDRSVKCDNIKKNLLDRVNKFVNPINLIYKYFLDTNDKLEDIMKLQNEVSNMNNHEKVNEKSAIDKKYYDLLPKNKQTDIESQIKQKIKSNLVFINLFKPDLVLSRRSNGLSENMFSTLRKTTANANSTHNELITKGPILLSDEESKNKIIQFYQDKYQDKTKPMDIKEDIEYYISVCLDINDPTKFKEILDKYYTELLNKLLEVPKGL